LLAVGGGSPHYVIVYLLGMALIALVCTALMKRDPPRFKPS